MNFFKKDSETLIDPFDERMIVTIGNQTMTYGMWKKEIKDSIKEIFDILNNVKENLSFKNVESSLKNNLQNIENQKSKISNTGKEIESQNLLANSNNVKLKEINNNASICMTELDKKVDEIKKISPQSMQNDLSNYFKSKIDNKFNELALQFEKEQEERLYPQIMANVKRATEIFMKKIILEEGIRIETLFENVEVRIENPIELIDFIKDNVKSEKRNNALLRTCRGKLLKIISKDDYKEELSIVISNLNNFIDLSKNKGDSYEVNLLKSLSVLQSRMSGLNAIKQASLENKKLPESKDKKSKEIKTERIKKEKPKSVAKKQSSEEDDENEEANSEDSDDLINDEKVIKEAEESEDSNDNMPDRLID